MPHTASHQSSAKHKARRIASRWSATGSESSSRAVVLVDATRLRHQEQQKCELIHRKIEVARTKIQDHETKSIPEYQQWFNSHFGSELTDIRELHQKVLELETIVDDVREECYMTGCSPRQAYKRYLEGTERLENLRQKHEEFHNQAAHETEDHDGRRAELLKAHFEMIYGDKRSWPFVDVSYDEAFEQFKKDNDEDDARESARSRTDFCDDSEESEGRDEDHTHGSFANSGSSSRTVAHPDEAARIKEIYRFLVRKLHPDVNKNLVRQQLELWHQVQDAYDRHNLDRLETLLAQSEMQDKSWDKIDGISRLRKLYQQLADSLKQLEKKIRLARKEAAWKFHEKLINPPVLKKLQETTKKELLISFKMLTTQHHDLKALINSWSSSKQRRPRKSK